MEVTGHIRMIGDEQQVSASFRKRELVVTTDEQYPQCISINFVQDKCDILNKFKVGESVKVGINLRGREWVNPQGETKYFNDIQGWKIVKDVVQGPEPLEENNQQFEPFNDQEIDEDYDDLPF